MTWLTSKTVWIIAAVCAVGVVFLIVFRRARGRRIMLPRRIAPQVLRIAAGLLMLLPGSRATAEERVQGDDGPTRRDARARGNDVRARGNSASPLLAGVAQSEQDQTGQFENAPEIDEHVIRRWRVNRFGGGSGNRELEAKKALANPIRDPDSYHIESLIEDLAARPESSLSKLLHEDLKAFAEGNAAPLPDVESLQEAFDYAAMAGYYDHWITAYLWRKSRMIDATAHADDLKRLYASVARHAHITDALIHASFNVAPTLISPRAWMSKAGPSREIQLAENQAVEMMLARFPHSYQQAAKTTWQRDAVLRLKLGDQSPGAVLWRNGQPIELRPGATFVFGRLDLLENASEEMIVLQDLEFGEMQLPPETAVTCWSLPDQLLAEGLQRVETTAREALAGDESAARRLEIALPLTHQAIRQAIEEEPDAAGAARLRMILTLFDDGMPAIRGN